jgi:hypothetical protein
MVLYFILCMNYYFDFRSSQNFHIFLIYYFQLDNLRSEDDDLSTQQIFYICRANLFNQKLHHFVYNFMLHLVDQYKSKLDRFHLGLG